MHKCDALSQYLSGATLTWCQNDVSTAKLASWMRASLTVPGQRRKHAFSKRCEVIRTALVTQKYYQIGYCTSRHVVDMFIAQLCFFVIRLQCVSCTPSQPPHTPMSGWHQVVDPLSNFLSSFGLVANGGHMQSWLRVWCGIPWKRTIHRVVRGYMKLFAEPSSEHAWSDGKWDAFPSLATMWQTW